MRVDTDDSLSGQVALVTDDAGMRAAVERVEEDPGRLDSLVNNAGVAGPLRTRRAGRCWRDRTPVGW